MGIAYGPKPELPGASLVAGAARRRRRWQSGALFFAIGILVIAAFNPVTLGAWWLRSPHVSSGAALRVWCWDVAVLALTLVAIATNRTPATPYRDERRPSLGAIVSFVLGLLLICTLLLEGVLRIRPGDAFSESLRQELHWRARHIQPSPAPLTDPIHVFSPVLGWEVRPNLRLEGITSNSQGLRGSREYARVAEDGIRRVICLGDSFIFGERLRDEETMPARLGAELNEGGSTKWEVLNLGVEGYGTDQQWLLLSREGLRYNPDVVVLGFFEEDLERNVLSFRDYAKPYFTVEHGRLALRGVPVPTPEELLGRPPKFPPVYLASFMSSIFEDFRLSVSAGDLGRTDAGRVTLAILDAMREAVVGRGAAFVLLSIPRPVAQRGSDTERLLEKWAQRTGSPFLNLRAAYLTLSPAERDQLYRGHWTPFGAAVTAKLLAEQLHTLRPVSRR